MNYIDHSHCKLLTETILYYRHLWDHRHLWDLRHLWDHRGLQLRVLHEMMMNTVCVSICLSQMWVIGKRVVRVVLWR